MIEEINLDQYTLFKKVSEILAINFINIHNPANTEFRRP